MADCMYIVTQDELDELEMYLEWYKTKEDLKAAAEKAISTLSASFAQVTASVEEILKEFSDWYLGIIGTDPEIYKPRTKPKTKEHRDKISAALKGRKRVVK